MMVQKYSVRCPNKGRSKGKAKVEMKELFELGQKCSPSPGEPDKAGPVISGSAEQRSGKRGCCWECRGSKGWLVPAGR